MSSRHVLRELTIEKGARERGGEDGGGGAGRGQREEDGWEGGREREKKNRGFLCA